jgi:hypothetical protein
MDKFNLPESGLADLSDDALRELEAEGVAAFKALDINEDSDSDTITEGERIADAVDTVRAELTARAEAAAERAEKVVSLQDRMKEVEPEAEVVETETATTDDTPEVVVTETPTAEDDTPAVTDTAAPEATVEDTQEAVAASASPAERAAANAPAPRLPKESAVLIASAAPDVPDFSTGQKLDGIEAVTAAVTARLSSMDRSGGTPHKQRLGAVRLTRSFDEAHRQDTYRSDDEMLDAIYASALENQSLVAAAGWSSPSETMYDLCSGDNTTDGTLSIPEFSVSRGGIRYTKGTDYSVVDAAVGFDHTEAEVIADTAKGSYTVPTPSFTDLRLDAVGVVVRAGLLQRVGYPEQIADVVQKALIAHQHKVSAKTIGVISTAAGAALTPVDEAALSSTLDSLLFAAESIRQINRLSDSRVFEVIVPHWMKIALKAEIGRRTARPGIAVSDAEVNDYFSSRNLAVQFVYGLDDLTTPAVEPQTSTTALIYPAGSWMRGQTDVANLDTIYDSTLLNTNQYTALFTEEGILAVQKCLQTYKLTIPVTITGRTGAASLDQPFGVVEA